MARSRRLARSVPCSRSTRRLYDLSAHLDRYDRHVEGLLLVVAAIVAFTAIVLLLVYNRFVRLRNMVDESWHDIGTELQRRYDLVPNLVNTVKGYAAHEREVFDSVTALRADAMAAQRPPDAQATREQALGQGVARL